MTNVPSALSFPPSGNWSGIDGQWSTFTLNVGTPASPQEVLIATGETVDYFNDPATCSGNSSCPAARGGNFNTSASSTYQQIGTGFYYIGLESDLGYTQNYGHFGYDTVSLGTSGPSLGNQIIANIDTTQFWLGYFGLLAKPFNISNYEDPYPAYLQTLKNANQIPSLSWAYNAGAKYQLGGITGSLTLGGYDASRFQPNNLTIGMNSDDQHYLMVNVPSINIAAGGNTTNALSTPINMTLDSSLPYIWIPQQAAEIFQNAFNLDYDNNSGLHTLSQTVHDAIVQQNPQPSVTFTIADPYGVSKNMININLPYAAFDLTAIPPLTENETLYFPIKVANNSNEFTIGRAFFQEAYVIANFESANFSVSQAEYNLGAKPQIVSIASASSSNNNPSVSQGSGGGSNAGAIAGGVIGGVVGAALIAAAIFFFWRRSKKQKHQPVAQTEDGAFDHQEHAPPSYDEHHQQQAPNMAELASHGKFRPELDSQSVGTNGIREYYQNGNVAAKHDSVPAQELDATVVHELEGSGGVGGKTRSSRTSAIRTSTAAQQNTTNTTSTRDATTEHAEGNVSPEVRSTQESEGILPGAFTRGRSTQTKKETDAVSAASRSMSPASPSPAGGSRRTGFKEEFTTDGPAQEPRSAVSPVQSPNIKPADK